MELNGEYEIAAPQTRVWALLNDPDVLKQCIPGCEELVADGEHACAASADVGGKIAQLDSRLIASTSKKLEDQFFGKFAEIAGALVA